MHQLPMLSTRKPMTQYAYYTFYQRDNSWLLQFFHTIHNLQSSQYIFFIFYYCNIKITFYQIESVGSSIFSNTITCLDLL